MRYGQHPAYLTPREAQDVRIDRPIRPVVDDEAPRVVASYGPKTRALAEALRAALN